MQFHFYADQESIELLASARRKALLIGGDFGYGNFGDVLQHIGAVRHVHAWSELAAVSVFSLDALSRHVAPTLLRKRYAMDALLFVTEMPIASDQADKLGLRLVRTFCNVSLVHLYGGGYLNAAWGGFVLGVAEHFLGQLPGVPYAISGQQLSAGFERRIQAHVERFKPALLGMRDRASLARACQAGLRAEFSFDDAVEPLLSLRSRLELCNGDGVFIHLNSSDYTGNDDALARILVHMREVVAQLDGRGRPVLLQAFQDAREEVVDTVETVKRLEAGFPFSDIETALLVRAILEAENGAPRVLQGRFGYSCSYHVALWLQLNGIPCWLRGSNEYYSQKREALGIEGGFEDFLAQLPRPDHAENLDARTRWLDKLRAMLQSNPVLTNRINWEPLGPDVSERVFHFKGEPRLQTRLDETWAALTGLKEEKERWGLQVQEMTRLVATLEAEILQKKSAESDLLRRLDEAWSGSEASRQALAASEKRESILARRIEGLSARITALGAECRVQESRVREAKAEKHAMEGRLTAVEARLAACSEQLTMVGCEARDYRERAARNHAALLEIAERERELARRLQEAMQSRSWRWTRPARVMGRYFRTGRFDPAGDIGLFEMARILGRKVPMPAAWRSDLGRWLQHFRRR